MALATDGSKSRAHHRTAAGRNVDPVLTRSPLNLANLITVGRLMLVVPLVWLIAIERVHAAFWVFVAAGVSDVLDGYIAKKFNARTDLGAYLDPLADKALLDGIYVALALVGILPVWLTILVVSRDLLIVLGVILIQRGDPRFRAKPLLIGKINTFAQIVLAACALAFWGGLADTRPVLTPFVAVVTLTTLWSGGGYAVQAMRRIDLDRPS